MLGRASSGSFEQRELMRKPSGPSSGAWYGIDMSARFLRSRLPMYGCVSRRFYPSSPLSASGNELCKRALGGDTTSPAVPFHYEAPHVGLSKTQPVA